MKDFRNLSKAEAVVVFQQEFTLRQKSHILKIMEILGRYMILEGNQLMDLYRKLFNDNMGESYLERAVRNRLVIELQYDLGMPTEREEFYYMLTEDVGYHVLKHCKRPFIEMPGGVAIEEVPRILTANQYMMAHGYVPDTHFPLNIGGQMKFFYTTKWNGKTYDKVILYFSKGSKEDGTNSMGTDQEGIVQNFNKQLVGATLVKQAQFIELLETIRYEVIMTKLFDVGDWTRATGPTDTRKFRNKLRALKDTVN